LSRDRGSEILTDLDEKENEETGLLKPGRAKRQIKGKRNKRQRYAPPFLHNIKLYQILENSPRHSPFLI
jgi:hypothetical protein